MSKFKRFLLGSVYNDEVTRRIYMPALETEAHRNARLRREFEVIVSGMSDSPSGVADGVQGYSVAQAVAAGVDFGREPMVVG